jgi:DNA-binding winged helix-turn-helix (wHTH) protein
VEPAGHEISSEGQRIHLEPKVMEVLIFLAGRSGGVVSKQELIDSVWQVEVISNSRLTRVIADLRHALGDDANHPRYIETIPTRGYRLCAEIRGLPPAKPVDIESASNFKLETATGSYPLTEGENTLGRSSGVDIRLDSEWVSRLHARIIVKRTDVFIEDLGSKNGTFVNGQRVNEATRLRDGDEISVGRGVQVIRFVTVVGSTRTDDCIEPLGE